MVLTARVVPPSHHVGLICRGKQAAVLLLLWLIPACATAAGAVLRTGMGACFVPVVGWGC